MIDEELFGKAIRYMQALENDKNLTQSQRISIEDAKLNLKKIMIEYIENEEIYTENFCDKEKEGDLI